MFTVTGGIGGVAYRVGIHDEQVSVDDVRVMGSNAILDLLAAHAGDQVQATPVSDPITLDEKNPASVLAFLYQHTDVGTVEADEGGTIPDVLGRQDPSAVY